jgi:co-chaperonin GroES (HSP10)
MLNDRVQVEILPEDEYVNGLYVAPNPATGMRNNYNRGKVLSAGNGRIVNDKRIPMTVKVGDIVMYSLGPREKYKNDDEKYYHIIPETDIWAILEEGE